MLETELPEQIPPEHIFLILIKSKKVHVNTKTGQRGYLKGHWILLESLNSKKKKSSQNSRIKRQNMRSEASNVVTEYSKLSDDVKNAVQCGTDEATQTCETDFELQSPQNTTKHAIKVHDALHSTKIGTTIPAVIGNLYLPSV